MNRPLKTPRGFEEEITIKDHEADLDNIVDRFRQQNPFPLEGELTAKYVLKKILAQNATDYSGTTRNFWLIAMTIFGWIGDKNSQNKMHLKILKEIDGYDEEYKNELKEDGKLDAIELASTINRDGIQKINEQAMASLKVKNMQYFDFDSTGKRSLFSRIFNWGRK